MSSEFILYKKAGGVIQTTLIIPTSTQSGNDRTFKYDFSSPVLMALGVINSPLTFNDLDSIVFKAKYRVKDNVGGNLYICKVENDFYLSGIQNPSNCLDKFTCNNINKSFSLIGYYFETAGNTTVDFTSCEQREIDQHYYLSIGPCCGNYSGGNFFPFEYRQWAFIDTLTAIIPNGYKFISARFRETRTAGSGSTSNSAWINLTPMNSASDTLKFDVYKYYTINGGSIYPSDDGFNGQLIIRLEPTCKVPANTYQNIKYRWDFKSAGQLVSSGSSLVKIAETHDKILLKKPVLFLQSVLPNINANNKEESWEVSISNLTNNHSPNTWFGYDSLTTGIKIIKIEDLDNGGFLQNNGEIFRVGSVSAAQVRRFRIYANYSSCLRDSLILNIGWNCSDGYPASLIDYPCTTQKLTLSLTPQLPNLLVNPIGPPGSIDLCDTAEYIVEGFNVQIGSAYNLYLNVNLPTGVTIIPNSSYFKYPDTANFIFISDPINISSNIWQWDISQISSYLDSAGLKGVLEPQLNKLVIKFKIITDCHYISGSNIAFNFFGKASCGAHTGQELTLASQLGITGGDPPYESKVVLTSTYVSPCSNNPTLNVKVINNGPSNFISSDTVYVIVPSGVDFVSGTFNAIHNAPNISIPQIHNVFGQKILSWPLPIGTIVGDSSVFSFEFSANPDDLSCGVIDFEARATSTVNLQCKSLGTNCDLAIITGDTTLPIFVYKSVITISSAFANSTLLSADSEQVTVNVSLYNVGENLLPSIPVILGVFYDADGDHILSNADIFLHKDSVFGGIGFNSYLDYTFSFNASISQTCNLILVIDSGLNPCMCEENQFFIQNVALPVAGPDIELCLNENKTIGDFEVPSFTYSWTPEIYLNNHTIANPIVQTNLLANNPDTLEFMVTLTKPGGCVSYDTVQVFIHPIPNSDFSVSNECLGDTLHYSNLSHIVFGGISTYEWNFGDGQTSIDIHPKYVYQNSGVFMVSLISNSDKGCKDTSIQNVYVHTLPVADFSIQDICLSDSATTVNTSSISQGNITSWNWNFGDGNTSTAFEPKNKYLVDGVYLVTLIAQSDSGCYDTISKNITIYPLPVANFNINDTCFNDTSVFVNLSAPASSNIMWDFGDGNQSIGDTVKHLYQNSGTYTVEIVVTSGNQCIDSIKKDITIFPKPLANFIADTICELNAYTFINQSLISDGTVLNFEWEFGDGNASNDINPTHLFVNDTNYIITLTATSIHGCTHDTFKNIIIHPLPEVDFNMQNGCIYDMPISFNNTSTINSDIINNWQWSFGDGNISANENPTHTFMQDGVYSIQLIATSNFNCKDSTTKILEIYPKPLADFGVQNICSYDSAIFINNSYVSSGVINQFEWNLGDGNYHYSSQPKHHYSTHGSYIVQLIVETEKGCKDTAENTIYIHEVPQANFLIQDICLYDSLPLINASNINNGSITEWFWNMGDGITYLIQQPVHNYQNHGNYNITLIVQSDSSCLDTIIKSVEIFPLPIVDFNVQNICLYDQALFTDAVNENNTILYWNFGDGNTAMGDSVSHFYQAHGTYQVQLIVESEKSCRDTLEKNIEVYPVPLANFTSDTICQLSSTQFENLSQIDDNTPLNYFWNFGDGATQNYIEHPIHTFTNYGTYYVALIVTSNHGCLHDTVIPTYVYSKPIANFTEENLCFDNPPVLFTNTSTTYDGIIDTWHWNFGDGGQHSIENPSHIYNAWGMYNVQLQIENSLGCKDTILKQIRIHPVPEANFILDTNTLCANGCISFKNATQSIDFVSSVYWNIGENTYETTENEFTYCFPDSGLYSVSLQAVTEFGCKNTIQKIDEITIYPIPEAIFNANPEETSIKNPIVQFINQSVGGYYYHWQLGDGNYSDLQHVQHTYHDTGTYEVMMIVKNLFECTDTTTKIIKITPETNVYIPNAFTPNLNNLNEVFNIKGIGILEEGFTLEIFDRWGEKIYTTNNLLEGWNGYNNGELCKMDVYVYKVSFKDVKGKNHYLHGHVSLIR